MKDLGILITDTLSWTQHAKKRAEKALNALSILKRNLSKANNDFNFLIRLKHRTAKYRADDVQKPIPNALRGSSPLSAEMSKICENVGKILQVAM